MNGTAKEAVRCGVGWRTPRRAAWTKGCRPQDYPCPKQKRERNNNASRIQLRALARTPARQSFGRSFPLEEAAAFNQGNPLTSVIGPQGFLVFENAPHLTVILYAYYEDARSFSCGRCTPCRMGTVLIAEALKNAVEGRGSTVDWDEIAETARHMKVSSLCGIGLQ